MLNSGEHPLCDDCDQLSKVENPRGLKFDYHTFDCAILLVPLLILIDSFEEVEIQKEDLQEY